MKRKIVEPPIDLLRLRNDIIEIMYTYPKGHPQIKKILEMLGVINEKIGKEKL
jgi:hypothetical protein